MARRHHSHHSSHNNHNNSHSSHSRSHPSHPIQLHSFDDEFSFISPCVKYSLFFFNLIFWVNLNHIYYYSVLIISNVLCFKMFLALNINIT